MRDWFNDGIHRCGKCEAIFKVYILDEIEETDFCPVCGCCLSGESDLTEEEINALEE